MVVPEETVTVDSTLKSLFCEELAFESNFKVAEYRSFTSVKPKSRYSKVHAGKYMSHENLLQLTSDPGRFQKYRDSTDPRKSAIIDSNIELIGGDTERGEVLELYKTKKIEGIIMIKGVADYGEKPNHFYDWECVAASAAIEYIHSKLKCYKSENPCEF